MDYGDYNKLNIITNLFEGKEIRSIWDKEKEEYFFSAIDVISALIESNTFKRYWSDLKGKLTREGNKLYENIIQLKMQAMMEYRYYILVRLIFK